MSEDNQEEENQDENNQEEDDEVDFDEEKQLEKELSYQEKLEAWFTELENQFGIDFANKTRQKINSAKELGRLLDAQEWESEFNQMIVESVQKHDMQTEKLQERLLESIEKNDEQSKKFFDRALKSLDDADKRDVQLGELVKQLAIKIDSRSKERHDLKMQLLQKEAD